MIRKKILIIDNHPLFAQCLSFYLNNQKNYLCKWTSQRDHCLSMIQNENFDLVILDLDMPVSEGFNILKQIREYSPFIPILIVTLQNESKHVLKSIGLGATSFILKSADPVDLKRGLEATLNGKSYYCRDILSVLANHYNKKEKGLSERQEEVLKLTAMEYTIKEIASKLNISTHTVISHRKNLMEKLAVKSQVGLAVFAVQNGYCYA
ncbi:MAG: response regulator transcription factor [Bacteroidota bacterium]